MSNQLEEIKKILFDACRDFKNDIIKIISDEKLKIKLEETFNELWHVKILLFVYLIREDKLNNQILEFCDKYNIDKNTHNINLLEKHLKYFLEIKQALI